MSNQPGWAPSEERSTEYGPTAILKVNDVGNASGGIEDRMTKLPKSSSTVTIEEVDSGGEEAPNNESGCSSSKSDLKSATTCPVELTPESNNNKTASRTKSLLSDFMSSGGGGEDMLPSSLDSLLRERSISSKDLPVTEEHCVPKGRNDNAKSTGKRGTPSIVKRESISDLATEVKNHLTPCIEEEVGNTIDSGVTEVNRVDPNDPCGSSSQPKKKLPIPDPWDASRAIREAELNELRRVNMGRHVEEQKTQHEDLVESEIGSSLPELLSEDSFDTGNEAKIEGDGTTENRGVEQTPLPDLRLEPISCPYDWLRHQQIVRDFSDIHEPPKSFTKPINPLGPVSIQDWKNLAGSFNNNKTQSSSSNSQDLTPPLTVENQTDSQRPCAKCGRKCAIVIWYQCWFGDPNRECQMDFCSQRCLTTHRCPAEYWKRNNPGTKGVWYEDDEDFKIRATQNEGIHLVEWTEGGARVTPNRMRYYYRWTQEEKDRFGIPMDIGRRTILNDFKSRMIREVKGEETPKVRLCHSDGQWAWVTQSNAPNRSACSMNEAQELCSNRDNCEICAPSVAYSDEEESTGEEAESDESTNTRFQVSSPEEEVNAYCGCCLFKGTRGQFLVHLLLGQSPLVDTNIGHVNSQPHLLHSIHECPTWSPDGLIFLLSVP